MPALKKGEMIAEAREWTDRFRGCVGCRGRAIIVMGRQTRVRVRHVDGCPLYIQMSREHPMLYSRDMAPVIPADMLIRYGTEGIMP